MVLRMDEAQLRAVLYQHKEHIGVGPVFNGVVSLIEGVFYIPAALTSGLGPIGQTLLLVFSGIFIAYGGWSTYIAVRHRYDADSLYEDIKHMDRTEVRSSIIAIRNRNNQYLIYYDEGWACDFFPNHATASPETNEARSAEYLQHNFGLPEATCPLDLVAEGSEAKPSTEHGNELRYYEYKLYRATVTEMPDGWDAPEFLTQGKRCKWLTLDEMMADQRTNGINHYVISLVRDNA